MSGSRDVSRHTSLKSTYVSRSWHRSWHVRRVPWFPIRDCARGCNNCVHTRPLMSAIDVTKKLLFERLYLVPGMGTFGPWVNCPYAPTTPTVHSTIISRFTCNFFTRAAPHCFGHHDSPSNLAESRYPPRKSTYVSEVDLRLAPPRKSTYVSEVWSRLTVVSRLQTSET